MFNPMMPMHAVWGWEVGPVFVRKLKVGTTDPLWLSRGQTAVARK